MDTKKLRQKILDLAIRGKLVPQDPNDEPASVLLERIRAEKERLIKEGKIKRSKRATATDDEIEAPFEIPDSWEWTRLLNIVNDVADVDHRMPPVFDNGIPYISPLNFTKDGSIDYNNAKKISIEDYRQLSKKCKPERGDIIFPRYGTIGVIRKVDTDIDFIVSYSCATIKPHLRNICSDYLFYVLKSSLIQNDEINNYANTTTQSNIGIQSINLFRIPLPPFEEQKRIVTEIERWFAVIDELESNEGDLLKAIDQAKSKILNLAIHGKLVPQEGEWKELKIKDAFIINPKNKETDEKLAGFVPMSNIQDGYRDSFICETKPWGMIKKGFTHFADGDIAVAKISPCLENRKSMVLANLPNGIGAGTTELIVFRCKENVIPKYGLYFFKTQFFIDSCVGTFNGVVGQQRVGKNIVEEIIIPLPPLNEQKRIAAKIEELFVVLDSIKLFLS